MHSQQWKDTRAWKLEAVGNKCEDCGESGWLEVHHVTYGKLGKESLEDLKALCKSCHVADHYSEELKREGLNP